jgi:hypothetical protein
MNSFGFSVNHKAAGWQSIDAFSAFKVSLAGARIPAVHSTKRWPTHSHITNANSGAGVPAWASPH